MPRKKVEEISKHLFEFRQEIEDMVKNGVPKHRIAKALGISRAYLHGKLTSSYALDSMLWEQFKKIKDNLK